MDWLKGMNEVIEHIEENLHEPIAYESIARIVGCSVYEFFRIFSFMTGISLAEYIRRRRLSQAVFDIQGSSDKIIDIALKYCYESPTSFTKAFKDLHGITPTSARNTNATLKTYPPLSFKLTIKGVDEMNFRIEKMDSFQIMGLSGYVDEEHIEIKPGLSLVTLWDTFLNHGYNDHFLNNFYTAPFWQVGAYDFNSLDGKTPTIVGAEYKGEMPDIDGLDIKTIPAATWAVFSICSSTGSEKYNEAYAKILTEWFPQSQYARNEDVPCLDVYPGGNVNSGSYVWEIWIPVLNAQK